MKQVLLILTMALFLAACGGSEGAVETAVSASPTPIVIQPAAADEQEAESEPAPAPTDTPSPTMQRCRGMMMSLCIFCF